MIKNDEPKVEAPGDFERFGPAAVWMRQIYRNERDDLVSQGSVSWFLAERIAHARAVRAYLEKVAPCESLQA